MLSPREEYQKWLDNVHDAEIYKELLSIQHNDEAITDRFYKFIDFGTAGLRGKMGAGTNFMNIYIIRRTTLAISKYMIDQGMTKVAIAYDSRNNSRHFALEAAKIFAKSGITTYIYKEIIGFPVITL
jgi:phosphomannomutase